MYLLSLCWMLYTTVNSFEGCLWHLGEIQYCGLHPGWLGNLEPGFSGQNDCGVLGFLQWKRTTSVYCVYHCFLLFDYHFKYTKLNWLTNDIYTCKCIYLLLRKCSHKTTDNNNDYTGAAHLTTELQSVMVHNLLLSSLTCDVWSKLKPVVICLPLLSLLWTFTSRVMPLIPLLLLNKEAYRGLPLWSCLVFCFLLRALQLSEAFPTVQRQPNFTEKTHEACTPLLNNNNNDKKNTLSDMSHQMLLSAFTAMEVKLKTPLSAHTKHQKNKRYTETDMQIMYYVRTLSPDDCIYLNFRY